MDKVDEILGLAVYEDYTNDINKFTHNLSDKLNADLSISAYDAEGRPLPDESRITHFGKRTFFDLRVNYSHYRIKETEMKMPTYILSYTTPDLKRDLNLAFYPNRLVRLYPLGFENSWDEFVNNLKFKSEGHQFTVTRYDSVRKDYAHILKVIGITELFITSGSRLQTNQSMDVEATPRLEEGDIPDLVRQQGEAMLTFQIETIIAAPKVEDTGEVFNETNNSNLIFRDKLKRLALKS